MQMPTETQKMYREKQRNDLDKKHLLLRPMTLSDRPFLEALYASTRWEEMQATGWGEQEILKFLSFQFTAQHTHYQDHYADADFDIITLKGEDAGRLYLQELKNEFRIVDIALRPACCGGGLGRHLLEGILDRAKARGKVVRIHVEHNNRAMNLYKRLGFTKIEELGVYFLMEANGCRG